MDASRTAVMAIGVNLVAVWVAAAAGGRAAPQPQGPSPLQVRQDRAVVEAQAALVEATDRLRRHAGPAAGDVVVRRDPFSFAGGRPAQADPGPAAPVTPPPPIGAPEVPAAPAIVLQGMAESREGDAVVRTAILSVGGELVFAKVGAAIGGGLTVVAIDADRVELESAADGSRQTVVMR